MGDYSSRRRQEEGVWQLVVKGRRNTNVVRGNHQRPRKGNSQNQNFSKNQSSNASTCFFITNFPNYVTAEILWNRCKEWGHVVDVYVPNKLSKSGKRFGFVCFLNVKYNRSLIKNLRSIWFGNHRLFADEVKSNNRIIRVIKADKKNMSKYEGEIAVPLDIQIEIMKRLPILMKFMSVSKQWKSIIQSSPFIADYNACHIQPPHHLFLCYDDSRHLPHNGHSVDIFNYDDSSYLQRRLVPEAKHSYYVNRLIGYSQGLFVFDYYRDRVVVIWNPSIRKSVSISVPEHMSGYEFCFSVVCNNNATEPTIFGITYAPRLQVKTYTLTTRAWKNCSNTLHRESIQILRWRRIVIDRFIIHWIAYDYTSEGNLTNSLILSFDIINEQFTEFSLPPSLAQPHTDPYNLQLYELRESLVVVEIDHVCKQEIGVWMMVMEPAGVQISFRNLYTVSLPSIIKFIDVLGFVGQIIFRMYDLFGKPGLFFYEPDLKRFNHIQISGNNCPSYAYSYMETLLLLDR